ncbi:hypothetical protein [Oceaniradius stylonematis]|uniref:hypothetical protein n=1 Tax=Oceaniradius stylonematis TaxID=2184161 RepID=UPI00274016BB|nr:hypothetical protein [Oceaniradius stylonematis]
MTDDEIEHLEDLVTRFRAELLPLMKGLKASAPHNLILGEALRVLSDSTERVSERPVPWSSSRKRY